MEQAQVVAQLQLALEQLADAIADEPPVAGALRRFASSLPTSRKQRAIARAPADPVAIRGLLYDALDIGAIDARRFDWLMIARGRAGRRRSVPAAI